MTNTDFEAYLARLVRLMPVDAEQRESIRDELRSHLEDRFDELLAQKVLPDEALRRAVDEFGDAAHLAAAFVSLTRTQRRRRIMRFSSATLVVAVLALLALTAFWPAEPGGVPAAFPPLAPATVQAQVQVPPPVKEKAPSSKSVIQQKLERPIDAAFIDAPIKDVLDYLSETLDVQFHLNRQVLNEAGNADELPVSISLKNIKAKTVLRLVLQNADLDFVEQDGFILVSTVEQLDRMLEVRVYNCRDLFALAPPMVGAEGGFGGMAASPAGGGAPMAMGMPGMEGGMVGGGLGEIASQSKLSSLIQTTVESETWDQVGGTGSIAEFNGLLVVKHSARVHEKIDELLAMLRKAADLEAGAR